MKETQEHGTVVPQGCSLRTEWRTQVFSCSNLSCLGVSIWTFSFWNAAGSLHFVFMCMICCLWILLTNSYLVSFRHLLLGWGPAKALGGEVAVLRVTGSSEIHALRQHGAMLPRIHSCECIPLCCCGVNLWLNGRSPWLYTKMDLCWGIGLPWPDQLIIDSETHHGFLVSCFPLYHTALTRSHSLEGFLAVFSICL